MEQKNKMLGVLGGLGPMSTVYFCELLTSHTRAFCDADHIDMIISSRASTPDRTDFILGKSTVDPLPVMIEDAKRLESAGATLLVIPCNTAHYFYDGLQRSCSVPMLNIIEETVLHLARNGVAHFGLLATEGTVKAGAYQSLCKAHGLKCTVPDKHDQAMLSEMIYGCIKQNRPIDQDAFDGIVSRMRAQGCQKLVLGCTELSLLKKQGLDDGLFVDSLEVLAYRSIVECGRVPVGFSADFSNFGEKEAAT